MEKIPEKLGLIGVKVLRDAAVMIEVCFEDGGCLDSPEFRSLVQEATDACMRYAEEMPTPDSLSYIELQKPVLHNLTDESGRRMEDFLVDVIESSQSNAMIRRAVCYRSDPSKITLCGMTMNGRQKLYGRIDDIGDDDDDFADDDVRPATIGELEKFTNELFENDRFMHRGKLRLGAHGTIFALQPPRYFTEWEQSSIGMHIMARNPTKVGDTKRDQRAPDGTDEHCLIYQKMIDESTGQPIEMLEFLRTLRINVVDFHQWQYCEEQEDYQVYNPATSQWITYRYGPVHCPNSLDYDDELGYFVYGGEDECEYDFSNLEEYFDAFDDEEDD